MLRLPTDPASAVIARDGSEVFMSFHFETVSPEEAERLSADLTYWLRWFLSQQDIVSVEFDQDVYNGE